MPLFDAATAQGLPAPFWFVQLFKTLGFALHLIPMGIILVGLPFSLLFWLGVGSVNGKRLAQRIFQQIPIFIALGINFGIVPLLFVQLAYPKAFYTPTILLSWHWLGVLPLTLVAYYASYLCASGAKKERLWSTAFWACVATVCFVAVGLVFSSVWTLFERPYEWAGLWDASAKTVKTLGGLKLGGDGAASGLAYYWQDPSIYLRFGGILGLAFYALATWVVFDSFYVYNGPRPLTKEEQAAMKNRLAEEDEGEEDGKKRRKKARKPIQEEPAKFQFWTISISFLCVLLGIITIVPTLGQYLWQSANQLRELEVWSEPLWITLLVGSISALALPIIFLSIAKLRKMSGRALACCMTFCELVLIGCFATMRQILQNVRLSPYFDPSALNDPNAVQWTPILAFLGAFLVAVALIVALIVCMNGASGSRGKKSGEKKNKKVKKSSEEVESSDDSKKNKETRQSATSGGSRKGALPSGAPRPMKRL